MALPSDLLERSQKRLTKQVYIGIWLIDTWNFGQILAQEYSCLRPCLSLVSLSICSSPPPVCRPSLGRPSRFRVPHVNFVKVQDLFFKTTNGCPILTIRKLDLAAESSRRRGYAPWPRYSPGFLRKRLVFGKTTTEHERLEIFIFNNCCSFGISLPL
jgi:hypothetical protein